MSEQSPIRYSKPKTGPHHYVCRDSLGQPNMINREQADAALLQMIGQTELSLLIHGFLQHVPKGGFQWMHVRDFLAGILKIDGDLLNAEAVIAFWAKALVALAEQEVGN